MMFLYFAYGSNMLPARLADRCPSARVRGLGLARHYNVEFSKPSRDGSGKATIVRCEGAAVPGVIFEIDARERDALDLHEGAGTGYDRVDDFSVELIPNVEQICVTTYIATARNAELNPFDWYLAAVIAGAMHHHLNAKHLKQLSTSGHVIDLNVSRPTRLRALRAMRADGIEDYRLLLQPAGPVS